MEIWQYNLFEEPKKIGKEPSRLPKYVKIQGELKDITRIKILDELYRRIYFHLKPKFNEQKIGKFIIYHDELQAEIDGTQNLSIREKIKLHIEALKEIKNARN